MSSFVVLFALSATPLAAEISQRTQAESSPDAAKKGKSAVLSRSLLRDLSSSMEALVSKVSPAVVQIMAMGYGPLNEEDAKDTSVFGPQRALGSGVIVDPAGYIITNAHVIEGAQQVQVILPPPLPNTSFQVKESHSAGVLTAKVIGVDRESDLAIIKISATNLPTLSLTNSHEARQGQLVFAIGSPEGLQDSVSMGVVSSPLRQPDPDSSRVYVQTDAPINPGNSGGPLVDIDGSLVGINTMFLTQGGGSEGLGFAIPASLVKVVYQNLLKYGQVRRAELQAKVQEITPDLASGLGLKTRWGVVVSDVLPGGVSAAAGLQVGDVVVAVDQRSIVGLPGWSAALNCHPLEKPVELDVLRGSRILSLAVPVLTHHEELDALASIPNVKNGLVSPLGVFGVDLNDDVHSAIKDLRSALGVLVVARANNGSSAYTGLEPGDVIRAINRTPVQSLEQLRVLMQTAKEGQPVVLQIERHGSLRYLAFEINR